MSERTNITDDQGTGSEQAPGGRSFSIEQLMGFVAMMGVAFTSGRAAMWAGSEYTIIAAMIFCTAIGGAIGVLRSRFAEGCAMGWLGFLLGIYFLIFLPALFLTASAVSVKGVAGLFLLSSKCGFGNVEAGFDI